MRFFISVILIFQFLAVSGRPVINDSDSIGVERIGDKIFILHQVEEKETLYSLSRRYGVSIKDIVSSNPSSEFGLSIGEILKIPAPGKQVPREDGRVVHIVKPQETLYSISKKYNVSPEEIRQWNRISTSILDIGQELIIYPSKSESEKITEVAVPVAAPMNPDMKYHVVKDGETLYSISKTYNVPLEDLREWNKLPVNDISIGQNLIVGKKAKEVSQKPANTEIPEQTEKPQEKEIVYADAGAPLSRENMNFDEVEENGLAELIDGSSNNRKYLALHRTAKVGTIMRVRNEMNGQEVFVRVIGKLPDTGANRNVLIKISRSAYDQLGAIDARFRVTISFIP